MEESIFPYFDKHWVKALINSPVQLFALGINFSQRDRLLETEETDLAGFFQEYLRRLAATDLENNWFAWYACAGHYNHDRSDAVPPYLRPDHHERSYGSPTSVRYHNDNIFNVLATADANTWTHFTLCDAVDWMPESAQRRLFDEILRTSQEGGRVLYRSVQDDSLAERLDIQHHFRLDEEAARRASAEDRTRQYRRVNFYTVHH